MWLGALNCEQGYEKRCTLPKSSPVDRSFFSWARQTALMSVPSEPSGHTPKTKTANGAGDIRGHRATACRSRPLDSPEHKTASSPALETRVKKAQQPRFLASPCAPALLSLRPVSNALLRERSKDKLSELPGLWRPLLEAKADGTRNPGSQRNVSP